MMVIRAVFMSLTTFFVAVKLYVRITKLGGKWWWDDYTVLLAYLVAIGFLVDNIFGKPPDFNSVKYDDKLLCFGD